jgi:hypothetical protein
VTSFRLFTNVPDPRPDPDLKDLYVFGPPGSASGCLRQRYESENPDPHSDPYQKVTDPQHCFSAFWEKKLLEMCVEARTKCGTETIRNPVVF